MKHVLDRLRRVLGSRPRGAKRSSPREDEKAIESTVIDLARDKVLTSGLVEDPREIEIVTNARPTLFYLYFGRPIADYRVRWQLNDEESVVVYGRGNILVLEGAHVERQ